MDRRVATVLCRLARGPASVSAVARAGDTTETAVDRIARLLETRALAARDGDGRLALHPSLDYDGNGVRRTVGSRYHVSFEETVESTNALATAAPAPVPPRCGLVVAREQMGGRGRYDRAWVSPPGGIWASILDGRSRTVEDTWRDQLAMAVAVTDVAEVLEVPTRLKWPNDIVTDDGEKLAGVLVEGTVAGGTVERTVCGVGLNADIDPSALPPEATSLRAHTGPIAPVAVLPRLLASFEHHQGHPEATIDRWRDRSHTLGRDVVVTTDDGTVTGTATGLDTDGALEVEDEGTHHRIPPERCRRLRYRDG